MPASLKWSLFAILVIYLIMMMLMYLFQRHLLYFPRTAEQYEAEHNFQLSTDKLTLRGWVINPGQPRALIYYGGNAERIDFNLAWMRSAFEDHTVYLINYRGYGGSDGTPTEQSLTADAITVYDHIADNHDSIDLLGRSLGTGVATYVAANRQINRLVLVTPYDSILNIARQRYPVFPVSRLLHDRWESWLNAARITSPTLIIYGGDDRLVPPGSTRQLITHFDSSLLKVSYFEHANHNDIFPTQQTLDELDAFLDSEQKSLP